MKFENNLRGCILTQLDIPVFEIFEADFLFLGDSGVVSSGLTASICFDNFIEECVIEKVLGEYGMICK
jgi:hypothetical protein